MKIVYSSADIMGAIEALKRDTFTGLDSLRSQIAQVQQVQATHTQVLQSISQQENTMSKKLSDFATDFETKFQALTEDVAAGKTVSESAITLLNGISAQNTAFKAQIQELIDAAGTDADRAKLQAVADGLDAQNAAMDAQRQALADAVAANTAPNPTE